MVGPNAETFTVNTRHASLDIDLKNVLKYYNGTVLAYFWLSMRGCMPGQHICFGFEIYAK